MPQRWLHKAQALKAHKEVLTQPQTWIYQKSLKAQKRCWGEVSKALGGVFSLVEPASSKGGKREAFILSPKKLAVGN
jgi:hypothetical protein